MNRDVTLRGYLGMKLSKETQNWLRWINEQPLLQLTVLITREKVTAKLTEVIPMNTYKGYSKDSLEEAIQECMKKYSNRKIGDSIGIWGG